MVYRRNGALLIAAGLTFPTASWAGTLGVPFQLGRYDGLFHKRPSIHCNKHSEGNQISRF